MSNILYGDAPKVTHWYIGPHGYPMHRVITRGWQSASLNTVNEHGGIEWSSDDFPSMEEWGGIEDDTFLGDDDGNEFILEHCRLVKVYDGFDPNDFDLTTDPALEAWPDHIVEACMRSASLRDCGGAIAEGRGRFPKGFEDDTLKAVFDRLVLLRIKDEIEQLEQLIKHYRVERPDETELPEPEENADALLAIADDKHAAQMADLEPDDV